MLNNNLQIQNEELYRAQEKKNWDCNYNFLKMFLLITFITVILCCFIFVNVNKKHNDNLDNHDYKFEETFNWLIMRRFKDLKNDILKDCMNAYKRDSRSITSHPFNFKRFNH